MATFYTDSGSFNSLTVSGSTTLSASRGIALQVKSSGSTIFSVSGSGGEIFNISDVGSSTALFTVASGSTNILNVDNTKAVSVSGSLVVTGSAYIRGLGTTAQTNIVTIDTTTGQLFVTASSAIGGTVSTPSFIATGSISASVNVNSGSFQVTSGSNTFMFISSSGNTNIGVPSSGRLGIALLNNTTPATSLQVNGGITVGQSGSSMNQAINFIRSSDGASMNGISAGSGIIQIGGANLNFVDIYTANEFTARFSSITAGPGTPALNLRGPLFISGSGYGGTVDYMLNISGSGTSGSFKVNNTMFISSSSTTLTGSTNILTIRGSGSANPQVTVIGSQGELFSVTDTLSGSLFSVNDVSGLPILDVNSNQTTKIGSYLAPGMYASTRVTANTGITVIYNIPTASYDAVWYEYSLRSGSAARVGQITAMWSGSSVISTETAVSSSTAASTSSFTFGVQISGSNMILSGSTLTNGWTVKTIIRAI
jgi:hypothetical protein